MGSSYLPTTTVNNRQQLTTTVNNRQQPSTTDNKPINTDNKSFLPNKTRFYAIVPLKRLYKGLQAVRQCRSLPMCNYIKAVSALAQSPTFPHTT